MYNRVGIWNFDIALALYNYGFFFNMHITVRLLHKSVTVSPVMLHKRQLELIINEYLISVQASKPLKK